MDPKDHGRLGIAPINILDEVVIDFLAGNPPPSSPRKIKSPIHVLETLNIDFNGDQSRAREFAIAAHGDQRYGDQPYSFHLDMVAEILTPFGEQAQVVGYLHDVVEDTEVSLEAVRAEFGELVGDCVALVTDETGVNRKERKAKTNKKLASIEGEKTLALIVKAADRLANLRVSALGGSESKLEMYRAEHTAFRQAAYRSGLCENLWNEMDLILNDNDSTTME